LLGHALLWPLGGLGGAALREALCHAFDERIVATLRLSFIDQDDLLAAALNAGQPGEGASGNSLAEWREPPAAAQPVSTQRLVIRRLSALAWKDAAKALLDCLG
jgi:5-methylcytosine-specific restriction protein B